MKRTMGCGIILCLALTLAVTATALGHGLGTLAGTVEDAQGRPVAGASVIMQSAAGTMPLGTTTNSHGRFFFPRLLGGMYDVRATTRHRASHWKNNVTVRRGRQTDVILRLVVPIGQHR
jgi:protocatechuate 3,4-dioxygenase beta subunit